MEEDAAAAFNCRRLGRRALEQQAAGGTENQVSRTLLFDTARRPVSHQRRHTRNSATGYVRLRMQTGDAVAWMVLKRGHHPGLFGVGHALAAREDAAPPAEAPSAGSSVAMNIHVCNEAVVYAHM